MTDTKEAILIPGAMPFKQINPVYPIVAQSYPTIGKFFHASDAAWQLITYSQNPLAADRALAEGVQRTIDAAGATDGPIAIIGESMGSMVAWRAAEQMAKSDPNRDVKVVLIAPLEVGVAEYFKEGAFLPIFNYTVARIDMSPHYPTTIVIGEYDGWADPPDRPWNLISSANALAGINYVHGPPSFAANPADGITTPPSPGENVTTVFLPTKNLPLTQVFRDIGVPDALVDKADDVLRPVIDAGYVRHDKPGDTRPYLYDGEIHRNVQSQQQARETAQMLGANKPDLDQGRREHPTSLTGELRQAVRTSLRDLRDLRDKVEAGVAQLKDKITDRLTKREDPEG